MTCTFFQTLPWHPQQIFCTSTILQNLKTVSYTAKNLLTLFFYIIIEEPRSCLIIARNRLGQAMLLLDLAQSFPRRNINPGIPPALSQPRSCCHAARCIKTQFSWKQNAPWSVGEALGMVRILMPGELKCLPFEMSSCQSKYL